MPIRKFLLISLLFLLSINIQAQKTDDAVKEKQERETKLLEQILTDAGKLRLPENRAVVYAKIGAALWQTDEKRARGLFENAVNELIAAQMDAQNDRINKSYLQPLIYGNSPRHDLINLISAQDAELALELLLKSRPPAIQSVIQNLKDDSSSSLQQYARMEIALEQRLIGMAAEQNPQTAEKRFRESVKKGVTYETLNLLKKIHAKAPKTAEKLAEELFESFLKINFSNSQQNSEAVSMFIADFGRTPNEGEKPLRVSDELFRRLILKMTDDWLSPASRQPYGYTNCKAVVEKLFPERAAQINKKVEQFNRLYQNEETQEYSRLLNSETAPEEMIARAEKFQTSYRNEIYRNAAQKLAAQGKIAEAERILQSGISDGQEEYYLSHFYLNLSYQLAGQGKFNEANYYINQITDENQRVGALIYLANSAYTQNPKENQKLAEGFLAQARALLPDQPETQMDFNSIIQLAAGYAQFDADESFRLLESLLPTLNEVIQANFVTMKFRGFGNIRRNEFQIASGGSTVGIYQMESALRTLKEKDFERALQFASGINRAEVRVWLQMQLIDRNLSNIISLPVNSSRYTKIGGE